MGCGTDVSCWLPGRTQMGDFVQKMRTKCEQTLNREGRGQMEPCHPLHHFLPVLQQSPVPKKHHRTGRRTEEGRKTPAVPISRGA